MEDEKINSQQLFKTVRKLILNSDYGIKNDYYMSGLRDDDTLDRVLNMKRMIDEALITRQFEKAKKSKLEINFE